jgi:hypothetical protein
MVVPHTWEEITHGAVAILREILDCRLGNGPAWSEGRLLGYGYAYEQAAKAKVTPRLLPSIEGVGPVAPLLEPLRR